MSFTTTLLAPLVLMLPVAGAVKVALDEAPTPETSPETSRDPSGRAPTVNYVRTGPVTVPISSGPDSSRWSLQQVAVGFRPDAAQQVRIEQRMTIRITPRAQAQPNMLVEVPARAASPRVVERPMGKCLDASGIAGVQGLDSNRLLLFMRNRLVVSATLEPACRARDFYSGFYLENSSDGKLCVGRDTLQSRSGANCRLTRISRLVEVDE